MNKIKLSLAALVALVLTSCGTYTYQESTARYAEPLRTAFITPVVADMEVSSQKIVNTVEIPVVLKQREINAIMYADYQGRESALVLGWKKHALAQTLKKFNADDIVAPTFTIAPSPTKQDVLVVTVTGFTAVYTGFRKATKADVELFAPFVDKDYMLRTPVIPANTPAKPKK